MTWLKFTELDISLDVFAKYSSFAFITKTEYITAICHTITLRQGVEVLTSICMGMCTEGSGYPKHWQIWQGGCLVAFNLA